MSEPTVRPFQAEVSQILQLVVNSLYSHKEIFLRELVSNASDALDKLRFEGLARPELLAENSEPVIRITPDSAAGTLTLWDNGIGMSEQELAENLGTIARSGTREFLQRIEAAKKAESEGMQLIGQFGVGFYSAYLVADRVDVVSRAAGQGSAFRWSSDAKSTFTIEPAERSVAGTTITLHLKEDQREFLNEYRLRELVRKYSDFIGHAIELPKVAQPKDDEEDSTPDASSPEFERVNQGTALWKRKPEDVTPEQYDEFYKHLAHDWESALAHKHFHIEGTQLFSGLLYLPKRPAFDLYDANARHGVRLYVKRIFIMDDCEELLPRYLRFVRGVVDSEDLPLNVSREILQDSRLVKVIRKQVVAQALTMIEDLAQADADGYRNFWREFGASIKEGLHFEAGDRERIAKLVRFESSIGDSLTSLGEYVARMKEGQPAIYYATGDTRSVLESSPHLEQLKKRGFEVLYMTDPVDPFAVQGLSSFDGKPLISAMEEDLKLDDAGDDAKPEDVAESGPLFEALKALLSDRISEVRISKRLLDSPACLVIPEGGLAPHMERMMRARKLNMPPTKRILEVNPGHPVIVNLGRIQKTEPSSSRFSDMTELLYDQALIAEGSPVSDPGQFARRLSALLGAAAGAGT